MLYICEKTVLKLLKWDEVFKVIEAALISVTKGRVVQNPRVITKVPNTENTLYAMPGYVDDMHALGCKLVTAFPKNVERGLPSILANILIFNEKTGQLHAVIDGTELTAWRTAAASAVATHHLRMNKSEKNILAIVGSGAQAKSHCLAFQHFFKFNKVHIWGRTPERAKKLVDFLKGENIGEIQHFLDLNDCVKEADVIVTTTYSKEPLIKHEMLKNGYHVCAVGAGNFAMELCLSTYQNSHVFVDNLASVKEELGHLIAKGVVFKNEIGAVIEGNKMYPTHDQNTIFQSLGMAAEDCAVAKLIITKYNQQ